MNDDVQLVREIGEVKAELSGLKAEVAGPFPGSAPIMFIEQINR